MRFNNPILSGFYPDPSICRVDDGSASGADYYLVTSTFEYFPGVPLFHSRDLVHWQQIGHCLTRESQLPLQGTGSSGGIFAPTIRHHAGRFYMVTTHIQKGNFYVWADDPAGPWSEAVWVDQGGIDPSLFFDTDGTVYFTSTGEGDIRLSTVDIATGQRTSETVSIWAGTGGRYIEAPHLYRVGDYYYLIVAEGGTEYGHMETIARSNSPWGPFASSPRNPILSHRDRGSHPIQATGHADFVQIPDGSWWAVFLAVRPQPVYPPCYHLGRETFLSPVSWSEDGWPVIGNDGYVELEMEGPVLPKHPWPPAPERDHFQGDTLGLEWNFRGNPVPHSFTLEGEGLELRGTGTTLDAPAGAAWVGRRQTLMNCRASTLLDFTPVYEAEEAGLTVLMNEQHHYEIFVRQGDAGREVAVRRRIGDLSAVVAAEPIGEGAVELSISADVARYRFGYRVGEGAVRWLAEGSTRYLATEVAGGFTGVYLGLYALGASVTESTPARFHWFEYAGENL